MSHLSRSTVEPNITDFYLPLNSLSQVFKKDQRPIVEFSIENRKALLARQKRLEKSVVKNPLAQANNKKKGKKGKSGQPSLLPVHEKPNAKENIEDKPSYVGSTNNPKVRWFLIENVQNQF